MAGSKLATAYYELIAATPNAEAQISSAIVPAAQSAGAKAGNVAGEGLGSRLVGALKPYAGKIASALSIAGVAKFAQDSVAQFSNLSGSIASLQRITGGTTEQVSALQGAMRLSGMDASKADTSLTIFAKKLQGVSGDSQKTAQMQQLLGTSITDANGKMKPMSELLPKVADKFKNMPDGVEKTALATQLFGRSGTAMLPFLNQGSAGIAGLEAKAKELGLTLDDGSKTKWAEYKKAVRNVQLAGEGLKTQVGEALIPVFTGFSDFISNTVSPAIQSLIKWFQSPAVQEFAEQAGQSLSEFGKKLGGTVRDGIKELKSLFDWVNRNKDWIGPIVAGIGAAAGALRIYLGAVKAMKTAQDLWTKRTKIATAVQAAFNFVMDANPVMLVVTAIAALVAGLAYFFTQTETGKNAWSSFTHFLSTSIESIKQWFSDMRQSIIDKWNSVCDWVAGVPGRIEGFFSGIAGWFASKFGEVKDGIVDKWNEAVDWVRGIPQRMLDALGDLGSVLLNAGRSVINGFLNGLKDGWNTASQWLSGLGDKIVQLKGPPDYDAVLLTGNGRLIMQGLARGLQGGWDQQVEPYVASLSGRIQSAFSPAVTGNRRQGQAHSYATPGLVQNINIENRGVVNPYVNGTLLGRTLASTASMAARRGA
jgi:hypothetical protein